MTSAGLRESLFSIIEHTLYFQSYLICLITAGTLVLHFWRKYKNHHVQKFTDIYNNLIIEMLISSISADELFRRIEKPKRYQFLRARALRETLINNIQSITGQEKDTLILCYRKLGLTKKDIALCYSFFWWRRVSGIAHLGVLEIPETAPLFFKLRKDRNNLVSDLAIIALSALNAPLNNRDLLDYLRPRAFRTQNFLVRLGANWARVHGHQFVIDALNGETRGLVVKAFVAAIADLNSPEAGADLIQWLAQTDRSNHDPDTIVYILRTLKSSGDPALFTVAEDYFKHSNSDVRAEALEMYLQIGGSTEDGGLLTLINDESVAVKRVWHRHQERKVA